MYLIPWSMDFGPENNHCAEAAEVAEGGIYR